MARNASGTYTLPAGNPVVSGTLIDATWANNTLSDLGNEMTDSLSRSGEGAMLAPLRITDGVQATPSLAFSNEPSSGLYRAGSNEWWAVAAGVQNLRFTNLGLTTRAAAGAVGTPSLAAFNDTDTGIYFPGANELAIATGGAARMTFDAAGAVAVPGTFSVASSSTLTGNVKIGNGVASNTSLLMVNRPSGNPTGVQLFQDGVESWIMGMAASSSTLTWAASGSTKMSLTSSVLSTDSSINVGIGTASPGYRLDVQGSSTDLLQVKSSGAYTFSRFQSSSRNWALSIGSNFEIYDETAAAARMVVDSSGNLGLGVTPSGWTTPFKVFQLGATYGSYVAGQTNGPDLKIGTNHYYNGTNYVYTASSQPASRFDVGLSTTAGFAWQIAGTGTAGNPITFTQAMTLSAAGCLQIGTGADIGAGNIGLAAGKYLGYSATAYMTPEDNASGARIVTPGAFNLATGGTTPKLTLDASGNLGVGTTGTITNRLQVECASGADRDIFLAGVTGASNGFYVQWNHATTKTHVRIANIPTSSAGLPAGTIWNDSGTLKIT